MFDRPKPYFYGSTTDHIVMLRPSEANAVLKLLLKEVIPGYFTTNLTPAEAKSYDSAATKLNAYIDAGNSVYCSDEDAEAGTILRPVK